LESPREHPEIGRIVRILGGGAAWAGLVVTYEEKRDPKGPLMEMVMTQRSIQPE